MMVNSILDTEDGNLIDVMLTEMIYTFLASSVWANPCQGRKVLQSLQGQSSETHFFVFVFVLKVWRLSKSFIFLGKNFPYFWNNKRYRFIGVISHWLNSSSFKKSIFAKHIKSGGENLRMDLDKSLSTPLTFSWWFLTELSLFSSFPNDDDCLIVRLLEALSWIRFFIYYWVACLQWSIHTGAQNSNCNSVKAFMLYLFLRTFKKYAIQARAFWVFHLFVTFFIKF